CPICFRTFDYRSSFRRHMRIHEGVYSHQCAVCGRKFTRKEHFDRHKCSRRPNKPSRSADGNVESSPEKRIKREVQLIDGHLCFVCPNCSKVFHRSSNFSRHMRIHRGVYSYLCPTCHRGFFRKEHFQKHKCH
ncbi:hypothetical protein CAPTEDRAFT_77208, partial [Capitella teleta]